MPTAACLAALLTAAPVILDSDAMRGYVDRFAEEDRWYFQVPNDSALSGIHKGVYGGQYVKNGQAFAWLKDNAPLVDLPDTVLLKTYYYRWWTFRKHIKNIGTAQAPSFVFTEYIDPVEWSDGATNTIAAPLGHHIYEGRWLNDKRMVKDYEAYWMRDPIANPRRYSAWLADAVLASLMVHGDTAHAVELLAGGTGRLNLVRNWSGWLSAANAPGGTAQQAFHNDAIHLFWQNTDRDAMEVSLTGDGYKPSLNAYLYGDAKAIAALYRIAAKAEPQKAALHQAGAEKFDSAAKAIRKAVQDLSWDPGKAFFMNGFHANGAFTRAVKREQAGFTPWYFHLPEDGGTVDFDQAWRNTVTAPAVFKSAYGLTSGAQNEAGFNPGAAGQCCRWDGPVWPFATSITLRAFSNLLRDYRQGYVARADWLQALSAYAASHSNTLSRGGRTRTVSWIDESLSAADGRWTHILFGNDILKPRGYSYNHSTFNDLILADLIGLRPRLDDTVEINPLAPPEWNHFAADNVAYRGKTLAVVWDRDGNRYGKGQGLQVFIDGKAVARSAAMGRMKVGLNAPPVAVRASRKPRPAIRAMRNGRNLVVPDPDSRTPVSIGLDGRESRLRDP